MNERQNPYVGPRAFETGETLYGRERELRQLESLLIAERLVLLHAPSGAGKTSLIQAGLIPNLREQDFNILPVMRVNLDLPSDIPAPETANRYLFSTLVALEETVKPRQRLGLDELMTLSLDEYLNQRPREADAPESDLLIFDQFEEILTTAPSDREGKLAFFAALGAALRNRDRWALFSMRDDYLGALEPYLRPIPGQLEHHYRLDLLSPEAALQAIQNPARESGVDFSDPAARKLVDDLRAIQSQQPDGSFERILGQHVEPVQLQVVCYRLWEALPEGTTQIAPEDVQKVGSVDEALGEYYAASLTRIATAENIDERVLRQWFSEQLITPEGIRGQALSGREQSSGLSAAVLRQLENAHLIRGETRAGKLWYELAHDRLVEPVRQDNARWFEANLSLLQKQAALWASQKRPDEFLLRGESLVQVKQWAKENKLTGDEQSFLDACRKIEVLAKRERRNRILLWVLTTISLLVAMVAIYFWWQAQTQINKVKITRAGELAAQSLLAKENYSPRSILLALEAVELSRNQSHPNKVLSEQVLRDVLLDVGGISLRGHESSIIVLAFSPDGKWLATGSEDKTIRLWDMQNPSGAPIILRKHEGEINTLAFSPDSRWLATGSSDTTIALWDLQNFAIAPHLLQGNDYQIYELAFSSNGHWLATRSEEKTARVWDMYNLSSSPLILGGDECAITALTFHPEGSFLATGCEYGMILLWNVQDSSPLSIPFRGISGTITKLAFSQDGHWLAASGSVNTVYLRDLQNLANKAIFLDGHSGSIKTIAFSQDGHWLAGSADNTVRLWNIQNQSAAPIVLYGHTGGISILAFSLDGKWLATGSNDNTVRLWDMQNPTATPIVLHGHEGSINTLDFSADSKWLATGSDDNTTRLWQLDVNEIIRRACLVVGRNFTPDEWAQYFPDESYRATCPQWTIEPEPTITPTP